MNKVINSNVIKIYIIHQATNSIIDNMHWEFIFQPAIQIKAYISMFFSMLNTLTISIQNIYWYMYMLFYLQQFSSCESYTCAKLPTLHVKSWRDFLCSSTNFWLLTSKCMYSVHVLRLFDLPPSNTKSTSWLPQYQPSSNTNEESTYNLFNKQHNNTCIHPGISYSKIDSMRHPLLIHKTVSTNKEEDSGQAQYTNHFTNMATTHKAACCSHIATVCHSKWS